MKMLKRSVMMLALLSGAALAAPESSLRGDFGVCDPYNPKSCLNPGSTPAHYLSGASNNATLVKGSGGIVYNVTAVNSSTTIYYLKLYDKATAPTCGTDTPVLTYPVPFVSGNAGGTLNVSIPVGVGFTNGIGFCLVANAADNDNTNAATGVTISLVYK
jgi:hypothetical protein